MIHGFWNGDHPGSSWVLWLGFIVLMLPRLAAWSHAGRAGRKALSPTERRLLGIVDEMHADGKISGRERGRFEADIRNGASRIAPIGPTPGRGGRAG